MDSNSLKSLKVADLKTILSTAGLSAPARSTKADLITRIHSNPLAIAAVRSLHPTLLPPESPPPQAEPSSPDPPPPTIQEPPPPNNSELEKRKQRAERFGVPLQPADPELEKRKLRAERFGIPLVETSKLKNATSDTRGTDMGKKRSAPVDVNEEERRKKRAERFGM